MNNVISLCQLNKFAVYANSDMTVSRDKNGRLVYSIIMPREEAMTTEIVEATKCTRL